MINKMTVAKLFRFFLTFLIFGIYIALVFFSFRNNWEFLLTFEYWIDTLTSTALALTFRWLYSDSGVDAELRDSKDIREAELGKGKLVSIINHQDLTNELKKEIDIINTQNKIIAYKNLCDKKVRFYSSKSILKPFRKTFLQKWRENKKEIDTEDFNINSIKITYYKYDLDEMLSTFYKEPNGDGSKRRSKNDTVINSTKTNVITLLAMVILKSMEILTKGFNFEDIVILLGQLTMFSINIYTGYKLGRDYIKNEYSRNLSEDYAFLKGFINKHKDKINKQKE